MEVCYAFVIEKKFINRGFLIGPYCPIYGEGAILVTFLLKDYLKKPVGLFIMSIAICSIVEYLGSLILEKFFNTRWWDYSDKKFNINGRICLETLIPFGVGCLLVMYIFNPLLNRFLKIFNPIILIVIAVIILICFIVDICISAKIIFNFRHLTEDAKKDNTEKITQYVRNEIMHMNKRLYTRLINAFPTLEILKNYRRDRKNGKNNKNRSSK